MDTTKAILAGSAAVLAVLLAYPAMVDTVPVLSDTYSVDSDWEDEGILTGDMETDSSKIYPDSDSQGMWTSYMVEAGPDYVLELSYIADMINGDGNISIYSYDDESDDSPAETFEYELESGENTLNVDETENYEYFEIETELEETEGANNERPNVDSISAVWSEEQGLQINDFLLAVVTLVATTMVIKSI